MVGGDVPAGGDPAAGDRAPHHDEDHRYAERMAPGGSDQQVLDEVVARLDALPSPRTLDAVTAAVAATTHDDAPRVAADGAGTIAFEAQVRGSGCLLGAVPARGRASAETGGFVMDGGCQALTGH